MNYSESEKSWINSPSNVSDASAKLNLTFKSFDLPICEFAKDMMDESVGLNLCE